MATSPEKIKMFSIPESGSDLSSFSSPDPGLGHNEEEVGSKLNSPLNPTSSPSDQNPKFASNQLASPSHEVNSNPCTNQNKKRVLFSCSEGEGEGAGRTTEKEKVVLGTGTSAVRRKLPTWASNKTAENQEAKAVTSPLTLPQNVQQVIGAFSVGFDGKKYADLDLLEVAEMEGIVFDNPSWWPAEQFPDSFDQGNAGAASGRCV